MDIAQQEAARSPQQCSCIYSDDFLQDRIGFQGLFPGRLYQVKSHKLNFSSSSTGVQLGRQPLLVYKPLYDLFGAVWQAPQRTKEQKVKRVKQPTTADHLL